MKNLFKWLCKLRKRSVLFNTPVNYYDYVPSVLDIWNKSMDDSWNRPNIEGEREIHGIKPAPVPHFSRKKPHGLAWDQTRASAARSRQLTAWAIAQPRTIFVRVLRLCINVGRSDYQDNYSALKMEGARHFKIIQSYSKSGRNAAAGQMPFLTPAALVILRWSQRICFYSMPPEAF
jgi:hypothetical protein